MESEHDTKVARHMGQDKTVELIRRNFWWPKMKERISISSEAAPNANKTRRLDTNPTDCPPR